MKILITTEWYTPAVNGVVTSLKTLIRQLEREGHEVRVLTLAQRAGAWRQSGYREGQVWYLPSVGAGRIYPGARAVGAGVRPYLEEMVQWGPDVVHSQCEFATFLCARWIVKRTGAALVHTYHTVYEEYTHYFSPVRTMGRRAAAAFSRLVANRTDAVIAPTDKVKRMLEGYGVTTPVHTVPSGIDCARFARAADKAAAERTAGLPNETAAGRTESLPNGAIAGKTAGLRDVRCDLIMVGRLAREKNVEEILRWLAGPEGHGYTCLIVGDGPARPQLEQLAAKLGLLAAGKSGPRVVFAGMVPMGEVQDWYPRGRIFVSASTSETQGLTYLEALSCGIPAVCRRDDCLDGVIVNGENGWQYTGRESFFGALRELSDEENYRRMAHNARLMAQRFDASRFGRSVLEVYRTCLGKERVGWRQPARNLGRLSG